MHFTWSNIKRNVLLRICSGKKMSFNLGPYRNHKTLTDDELDNGCKNIASCEILFIASLMAPPISLPNTQLLSYLFYF